MQELDRSSNALQWSPSQLDVSCVAKIDRIKFYPFLMF